jgi:hypothetical protein
LPGVHRVGGLAPLNSGGELRNHARSPRQPPPILHSLNNSTRGATVKPPGGGR